MITYNLQYFSEEEEKPQETETATEEKVTDAIDVEAFADIISEKDKQITELQKDVAELKKSNAQLLVRVSAGTSGTQTKSFEEKLLDLVGAKPRKE